MVRRFQTGNIDVFQKSWAATTVGLIEQGLLFPEKLLVCGWN